MDTGLSGQVFQHPPSNRLGARDAYFPGCDVKATAANGQPLDETSPEGRLFHLPGCCDIIDDGDALEPVGTKDAFPQHPLWSLLADRVVHCNGSTLDDVGLPVGKVLFGLLVTMVPIDPQ